MIDDPHLNGRHMVGWFIVSMITLFCLAVTILEVALAFHLSCAYAFVYEGMRLGSVAWIMCALFHWCCVLFLKYQGDTLRSPATIFLCFVISTVAVITQASIRWNILVGFSLWANAAIWVIASVVTALSMFLATFMGSDRPKEIIDDLSL
jgi:hypothetical protein